MIVFVAVLLTGLVATFVGYPLVKKNQRGTGMPVEPQKARDLSSKRSAIDYAMETSEIEYRSGSLSKEDYLDLKANHEKELNSIVSKKEEPKKDIDVDDELERMVLERRQAKSSSCPRCGARHRQGDVLCSKCGAKLRKEGAS